MTPTPQASGVREWHAIGIPVHLRRSSVVPTPRYLCFPGVVGRRLQRSRREKTQQEPHQTRRSLDEVVELKRVDPLHSPLPDRPHPTAGRVSHKERPSV